MESDIKPHVCVIKPLMSRQMFLVCYWKEMQSHQNSPDPVNMELNIPEGTTPSPYWTG